MRGRIRRPAYEEQHKFRPTSRGTNVYVGSRIPHFNPLTESFIGAGTKQGELLKKILIGQEITPHEGVSWLGDRKTRNLMMLFMDRLDSSALSYITRRRYDLPARLKAVELLADNFKAICDIRDGFDYAARRGVLNHDHDRIIHDLVYEKWQNLRNQGYPKYGY